MRKVIILLLSVLMLSFMASCRGERSVKVTVQYDKLWTAWLGAGDNTRTLNGYYAETVDLGDYKDKVEIVAWRDVAPQQNDTMRVAILEEYKPGFLYTANTYVKAEASATTNTVIPVDTMYDFKKDFNQ
ncbi:MAG TPA: hypothetical protein P5511_05685 [Candidatus Goldiibacteriota bacterium]|nr:hypothetical protein [Candidatus Goldiibacteriota bacterium]